MKPTLMSNPKPQTTASAVGNRRRSFWPISEPAATPKIPASTVVTPKISDTLPLIKSAAVAVEFKS